MDKTVAINKWNSVKRKLKIYFKPFLNWRFTISFGTAWIITNGWSYICLLIGTIWRIPWLISVSSAYIAFLYLPFTAEKLITIPLSIFLHEVFFHKDLYTRKLLEDMHKEAKADWKNIKSKFKRRKLHMKTHKIEIIGETFQEISDIVTGTMGAKGKLAIIADEFSRPYLTDDGVTVAKECLNQADPFKKMVATSMIEAANNTEKAAFDGTTLTILLTNELYKAGFHLIKKGMHPQEAAKRIELESKEVLRKLKLETIEIKKENAYLVRDIANITTKIPEIGQLVFEASKVAGSAMNIIIEHDRKITESVIEHTDGMIIDSGYFSQELKSLCSDGEKFEAEQAKIILLAEGVLTPNGVKEFFGSIKDIKTPLIFIVDKGFNPDSLHKIMNTLVDNKLLFMFVFINDSNPEEIFLDIAAKTGGKIQSTTFGTTDYRIEYAGTADKIIIEQDKTTIISKGNEEEIKKRLATYKKELEDKRYTTGYIRADIINRRMSNLDKGVTKIKLAADTITEFRTIRFKLDDAIGAVRCAYKEGVVIGAGKALYLLGNDMKYIKKALQKPAETIIKNAGLKIPNKKIMKDKRCGLDVKTGEIVNLKVQGIVDSYSSIAQAVINATSIATSYLKSYVLINGQA